MKDKIKDNDSLQMDTFLVKCDLSNIQDFIFNVKSEGAARALKGRSFFLKLLLQVLIRDIFEGVGVGDLDEKEKGKISISGGNFILKVTTSNIQYIDSLQMQVDQVLRSIDLNVVLAYVPFTDYRFSMDNLDQACRESKYKRYSTFNDFRGIDHSHIKRNNDNYFWHNLTDFVRVNNYINIGKKAPKNSDLHFIKNGKDGRSTFFILGYAVQFSTELVEQGSIRLASFLESLIPIYNNSPKTFKELVEYSTSGAQKLGVLAMDVDGLGSYFGEIDSSEEHKKFDKKLNDFFNKTLRSVINDSFKNNVYTVTAGGDDSYFVGKWDILLDLSLKIKDLFCKEFNNENLTISAALILVDSKFPVVRFADMVDVELKKAKYPKDKGNISLFGEVIKWRFLEVEILRLKSKFIKSNGYKKELKLSAGVLAKARLTAKSISKTKGVKLSDHWKMQYYLRNKDNNRNNDLSEVRADYKKYMAASSSEDISNLEAMNYRLIFPIAARLAELETRKK